MRLETTLLDKFVHSSLLGKRQIGRPLKHNLRHQGHRGWIELIFHPRNQYELVASKVMRTLHPYLAFFTYKFHVEKAREGGFRVEDVYANKFFKEPYVQFHIYAQYFHPTTLHERVRDVSFYRRPRTLFKGFTVPDWAQNQKNGFDIDIHSRNAWRNAMEDLKAEWTPTQFGGQRLEPNPLSALRFEYWGGGFSSRLFFNEVPQERWLRDGGHLDNKDKYIYSFKYGDQDEPFLFGIDTTTEEGRAEFKKIWDEHAQMTPELISKDDVAFPHEAPQQISQEPHFLRVWQDYRKYQYIIRLKYLVDQGHLTQEEHDEAWVYLNTNYADPSFRTYLLYQRGLADELKHDTAFQAFVKGNGLLNLDQVEYNEHTSQPIIDQFWEQYDVVFGLTEEGLKKDLGVIITDPSDRARVEAILNNKTSGIAKEQTQYIQ